MWSLTTGWMHNRVRMIVASFPVKHRHPLAIRRRVVLGYANADVANNAANWHGSPVAARMPRIFNLQSHPTGEKFDPNGDYVRKWVPERADLSNKLIKANTCGCRSRGKLPNGDSRTRVCRKRRSLLSKKR